MADTLRLLAGDAFSTSDVISAFRVPLKPEELVLDRYVFLPHARTGIAAALTTPFGWDRGTEASVKVKVPVMDGRGALDAEMTVHVYGPDRIKAIDPRQVIRAFPKVDAVDAEVDDLVHVEFDRPDLPWLFTPTGPDAKGRLVPWITLVVAEQRRVQWGEQRGFTRLAKIRRDQLQPLQDAWAWAHAQVMGGKQSAADAAPTLENRLSEANAAHNLSRLVCPRRLDHHTAYVACVVPTFMTGVRTGLGLSPVPALTPAWGTPDNFAGGDPLSWVDLPVYYAWSFGTGEDGNFESLARKLRPAVAPPGVGRRRVDATRPWVDLALPATAPGAEIIVNGPVVSPQQPADAPPDENWPSEVDQLWEKPVADTLVEKLNLTDLQSHQSNPGPLLVGPPLYGSHHARQPRIEDAPDSQPQWFRELNLDPRNRIVGGLGTRVVQAEQEDLMTAAWNQVIGVEAANRTVRMAQLAKHVSASLHRRHLSRLSDAAVVSVTERVHPKVLDQPQRSIWASIDASSLPTSVTTGAFRRLARIRGPVVRAAVPNGADRGAAVEALTVRVDRLTTDWVLTYVAPDGISGIGKPATARLTDSIAAAIEPGADAAQLLDRWTTDLARPAPSDLLSDAELGSAKIPDVVDLGRELTASLVRRILACAPTQDEMFADPEVAITGVGQGMLLRGLIDLTGAGEFEIARSDAERLGMEKVRDAGDGRRVVVGGDALLFFGRRAMDAAVQRNVQLPTGEFQDNTDVLRKVVDGAARPAGGRVMEAFKAIGSKVVLDDRFLDPPRSRINAPALELIAKLDPGITVPARIKARLTGGSGRLPGWLAPGWFDDLRVEPVMAGPRFHYPMYEPLHRYDPEWMVPGLGLLPRADMATLLETNNRFIEGYLVGLNHEMGRELLWREYPTDQRGTYFSSFWTGRPELVADLHEAGWRTGELRSHMTTGDGQLVFLVRGDLIRRYPGVVAHAAREASSEGGIPVFEADSPVETLFHVHLPPNVLLVGFNMTRARIGTPGEKWWFTLSENPTEPRFGLDPSRDGPLTRDNLAWSDFGITGAGQFLDAGQHTGLTFTGVPGPADQHATWGASSAQVAFLLFQLPARAAFLATRMVAGTVH